MPHEHHVGLGILMRGQPLAKVLGADLHGMVRLVPRVDLGVNDVGVGQGIFQAGVDVGGKRAEGLVVAVEAVDIYDEQAAARVMGERVGVGLGRHEGLRRRRARVGGAEVRERREEAIVVWGLHRRGFAEIPARWGGRKGQARGWDWKCAKPGGFG